MADKVKVVTGTVRINFPHLFTAHASEEGKTPKFSAMFIVNGSDTDTINKINSAVAKVKEEFAKEIKVKPTVLKGGLRDGAERDGAEYEGNFFFNASSNLRPTVLDADMQEMLDPLGVKSGDNVRVSIMVYPYNVNGNRGVAFGLSSVKFESAGESLGGSVSATSSAAADFA